MSFWGWAALGFGSAVGAVLLLEYLDSRWVNDATYVQDVQRWGKMPSDIQKLALPPIQPLKATTASTKAPALDTRFWRGKRRSGSSR